MKTNNIKTVPKIFVIAISCLLFSNCNENTNQEKQTEKKANDTLEGKLAKGMDYGGDGAYNKDRILLGSRNTMIATFNNIYKSTGINTNIDITELKILWSKVKTATQLDSLNPYMKDTVIAKYFILAPSPTNKYFSYIITLAQKVTDPFGNDSIQPIANALNQYLLVTKNDSNGSLITATQFQNYASDYRDNVSFVGGSVAVYKHPYVSYHTVKEFMEFYSDNAGYVDTIPNITVKIENSARQNTIQLYNRTLSNDSIHVNCQSPILIFNNKNTLYINNIYGSGANDYFIKGMNVGRLCPPDC